MANHPPRHIVRSTDKLDLRGPFQKRWLLRQTLMHGTAQDIRKLDFGEINRHLDDLSLPKEIDSLWRRYFTIFSLSQVSWEPTKRVAHITADNHIFLENETERL